MLSPRALNSLRLGSFVGMFTSLEHGMMYARGEADVFNSSFSGLVTGSCFAAASMQHAAVSCTYLVHLTGPLQVQPPEMGRRLGATVRSDVCW